MIFKSFYKNNGVSKKKYSLYVFFGFSVCFFAISTWLDLSRIDSFVFIVLKYISVIAVFLTLSFLRKRIKVDFYSFFGLSVFLIALCFYTLIDLNGWQDLLVLSGYIVFFFIYYFVSKINVDVGFYLKKSLLYLGLFFVVINAPFVFDSSAYSMKMQFKGFFSNTNAFTGLAGFFLVLNFYFFNATRSSYKKSLFFITTIILAIYLILGFSRSVLLSAVIASFYIFIILGKKRFFLLSVFSLLIFLYLLMFKLDSSSLNRDLFEKTGRQIIFNNYWNELSERYFFIGTGVSIESGRIKSELSYLDIFLMTGFIGMVGFLLFIFRTFYISLYLKDKESCWLVAIFIYVVILSFFEGYAANILSLNSLFFYIAPALISGCYMNSKEI